MSASQISNSAARYVSPSLAVAGENRIYKPDEMPPLLDLFITIISINRIKPTY
jgi:hypothetical protein